MRFSLDPLGDLDVRVGTPLAELRTALTELTGDPSWRTRPLGVGGHLLGDDHPAGVAPWVAGAAVVHGPGEPDPVALALAAPWHLAVVAGPDAGAVARPERGRLVVGRGTSGPGRLALTDRAVSREHLEVRRRRRFRVRDLGSANGTGLVRAAPRGDPPGGRDTGSAPGVGPVGGSGTAPGGGSGVAPDGVPGPWPAAGPGAGPLGGPRPGPHPPAAAPRPARGGPASGGRVSRVGRVGTRLGPGDRVSVGDGVIELRAPPEQARRFPALGPVLLPLVMGIGVAVTARNPWFLLVGLAGPVLGLLGRGRGSPGAEARPGTGPGAGPTAATPPPLAPDAPAQAATIRRSVPAAPAWLDLARDGLAVVGPGPTADAVARALVTAALAADPPPPFTLVTGRPAAWRWCRWLVDRVTEADRVAAVAGVVVVDGPAAAPARWWADRPAGPDRPAVLLLATTEPRVPAWCAWRLVLEPGRAVLRGPTDPEGSAVEVPHASEAWAEAQARLLAGRARAATWPDRVDAAGIGLPTTAADVVAGWRRTADRAGRGLATPLGVGADGRVVAVDLAADGPHALVAGTTGAGKSELLQTLVAGLATRYPPRELALVLVDFKGGAGFGDCARLPHVAGLVTDLDPQGAGRALEALRAELRRREHVIADHGATDLESLRAAGGHLSRLLVVVDEFRALTEDLPTFVPGLVRIAAQGRSLGIHLVLATQRPTGAVDAQMRANVALRLCLRVTDPADSVDVVGVPDAAALPPDRPGRLLLGPVPVQSAWLALPPADRPVVVRRTWPEPPDPGPAPDPDQPGRLVEEIRRAARAIGSAATPVWSPPLPEAVSAADLAPLGPAPAGELAVALGDPPGGQGRCLVTVPAGAPLAVVGRPGSGRTTTLLTLARGALAAGRAVHVVAPPGGPWAAWGRVDHPGRGTVASTDDPRLVARLLTLLLGGREPRTLLVDGLDAARAALERMPRAGVDVDRALRDGRHGGLAVVVAGTPTELARSLALLPDRLVLPVADPADDLLLGVGRDLGGRTVPGRAVAVLGTDRAGLRCQVVPPDALPAPGAGRGPALAGGAPALRLRPIPERVEGPLARPTAPGRVVLGLGGDDAGPVEIALEPGLLVVGPAGSGRSTALAVVAEQAGTDVVIVDDAEDLDPAEDDRLAALLRERRAGRPAPAIVAAARTERAVGAYRGLLADLRATAPVLVLDPATPGSAEVAGRLEAVVDPVRPGRPGRGALVRRSGTIPLQVRLPGAAGGSGGRASSPGAGAAAPPPRPRPP